MLSSHSLVIARGGFRLFFADPAPLLASILFPSLLAAFLLPTMDARLQLDGFAAANGSEALIPGLAAIFAFVSISMVGTLFYREHFWGTWDRLRASPASSLDILVGKVAPYFAMQMLQTGLFFTIGAVFFGYRIDGPLPVLAVVLLFFIMMVVTFSVMMVSLFSTMDQAVVLGNMTGFVMCGFGGALAPTESMPEWVQTIAHFTPVYYALEAVRDVTLNGAGMVDVTAELLVLAGFSAVFTVVIALRFRPSDAKVGTT